MIYSYNFSLAEGKEKREEVDYGIVDLIKKNELGQLDDGNKLKAIDLRYASDCDQNNNSSNSKMMVLPYGEKNYFFTDFDTEKYDCGGFVYNPESNILFFAKKLIHLSLDYDAGKRFNNLFEGNYRTDLSFEELILDFKKSGVPLHKTIEEKVASTINSWPNKSIPDLGEMSYSSALETLRKNKEY